VLTGFIAGIAMKRMRQDQEFKSSLDLHNEILPKKKKKKERNRKRKRKKTGREERKEKK
jgi:hypothetical protein